MMERNETRTRIEETVVHEIGHQFDEVRKWEEDNSPLTDPGTGYVMAYTPPDDGETCIMYYYPDAQWSNGITRFCIRHVLVGRLDDHVTSIRDDADGK